MTTFALDDDNVIVIIGSGAGGGTLANELCQRGVRCVVLEAGPRYNLTDFEQDEFAMVGKLISQDVPEVTSPAPLENGKPFVCKTVGGTTVHWSGIALRLNEEEMTARSTYGEIAGASLADIQAGLSKLDPKLVASRTGGAVPFAEGKASGVVRRRVTGPQYAITHTRDVEYMMVTKGTATLVTGGTLIPPTIDSDPYPSDDPNAIVRSEVGVKGGLARRIGPGDVVVNLPGTPHWLSQIDGSIEYFEVRLPNFDPAPGIERAEVKAK